MNEQKIDSKDVKKAFEMPENAVPLIVTFLTPGDTPEEFKVGIFINETQPAQLLMNTLGAVGDIIKNKNPQGPQNQQPRTLTLKDFIED